MEIITHRVLECLSLRRNWVPSPPPPGGTHLLEGEGVGGPNSDEGTESLALYGPAATVCQRSYWTKKKISEYYFSNN
jgi:hypothetical protein